MAWFLVHHSVSYDCWVHCTIPTSVLKLESNSLKDFRSPTSSVIPILNKIVHSLGAIDFAFFCFSKIALKPSTKLKILNRQWVLYKCQWSPIGFKSFPFISIAFIKPPTLKALVFAPHNLNFFFGSSISGREQMCFLSSSLTFGLPLGEAHSYHSH